MSGIMPGLFIRKGECYETKKISSEGLTFSAHFELENLLDFVEAHSYSQDQVISALEYLKHEGYLSGLILYDDQGQPYHFIIDGMSRQGLDLLDSLSKESTL